MDELRKIVVNGPDPEKHDVLRYRCIDLCGEIKRRFDVAVDDSTVGNRRQPVGRCWIRTSPQLQARSVRGGTLPKRKCLASLTGFEPL